jgi:hypothetical protein
MRLSEIDYTARGRNHSRLRMVSPCLFPRCCRGVANGYTGKGPSYCEDPHRLDSDNGYENGPPLETAQGWAIPPPTVGTVGGLCSA